MALKERPVEKEDLFRMKFLQGGKLSPDNRQVVYVVSEVNAEGDKEYTNLWLASLESGETRQLTTGQNMNGGPAWSPDGKTIAFMSARGGPPQIYLLPVGGGEALQLTKMKQGVGGGPVWSPDGKQIAFTAAPLFDPPLDASKPYRVKRKVYRFDTMGILDRVVQDIYVIDAAGGEPQRLTNDGYMNAMPRWSPDGKEILYSASMSPDTPRYEPGLRVVTLDGAKRDVVWNWGVVMAAEWTPDGKRIVFAGHPDGSLLGTKNDLYIIDAQGEAHAQPENRTAGLKCGVGGGLQGDMPTMALMFSTFIYVSPDGETAYIQVQERGTVQLYRIALSGAENWESLVGGERTNILLDASPTQLLYGVSHFTDPTQLYISDIEGGEEKQLTSLNAELFAQLAKPTVERLLFPAKDGVEIEGWIMKPPAGQAPYPTILYIHGGPWGAFGNIFSFDFQMLAGAGYAVLFINYRGSSGYGTEFGTAIQAGWGGLDYTDQMAGLDYVIEKGIADPDRLGVCGLSAGGFGSCWVVGQTDRFKAAVPENPVTNLMTIYGVSDIGETMRRFMGGKPHEVPENYRRCSPITYAHRCKTPTLMIQGEQDLRCPTEQSEQFYAVLKDNGCIVEMLRLPNSPHAGSIIGPLPARRAQNDALLDWMNRYVLGKAPDTKVI